MGTEIVNQVVAWLCETGIRAEQARPARRVPRLETPCAAVSLETLSNTTGKAEIAVFVYSPRDLGGGACESYGEAVLTALALHRASCVLSGIQFDGAADCFRMKLTASLPAAQVDGVWTVGTDVPPGGNAPFAVYLGGRRASFVTRVTVSRATPRAAVYTMGQREPMQTATDSAGLWKIVVEEDLPAGAAVTQPPTEPFLLAIVRGNVTEWYRRCRWVEISQVDDRRGLHLVRTALGEAKEEPDE